MNEALTTLNQFKKADKFVRHMLHKNGPKSYKRGQGALLNILIEKETATQRELVEIIGISRRDLKDVVKKAERNGFVTIEDVDAERTYAVRLTDEGREVAQKRAEAQEKAAEEILSCLTDEEISQLNAISEKLIVSAKEKGFKGKKKCHNGRPARKGHKGHKGHGKGQCHHRSHCHAHRH